MARKPISLKLFLLVLLALFLGTHSQEMTGPNTIDEDPLVVHTTHGLVRGTLTRAPSGKDVFSFLGVPYAKPPVGNLRFAHPTSSDPWDDVIDATQVPNSCVQRQGPGYGDVRQLAVFRITNQMSEDCLKLNIWTPSPKPSNAAIMIWIHGGAFQLGSCALEVYDGKLLASEEDVIVVCVNYRLATLGFLFLDHPDVPGNAGLYDQLFAIQWVKDNARAFGGDPDKITVFGESAGAGATGYLLLSPLNRNLFSRAILQSGSPTSPWASTKKPRVLDFSFELASKIGCSREDKTVEDVVQCLRNADPIVLTEAQPSLDELVTDNLTPFPDGEIIPKFIKETLENKPGGNFSILFGNTANDGSFMMLFGVLNTSSASRNDVVLSSEDLYEQLKEQSSYREEVVLQSAKFLYTNWSETSGNFVKAIEELHTDVIFVCESERVTQQLVSAGNKVYSYLFDHRSTVKAWPEWMGVPHLDDVEFVFGDPLDPGKHYTEPEVELSKRVMRMWANFARTGDPNVNPDGSTTGDHWVPYSLENREYLSITAAGTAQRHALRARHCHFWNHHAPALKEICKKQD